METIEGNRLIAEFMDGVFKDLAYIRDTFPVIEYKVETHGLYCHPIKDLKYHSSWDWLMPVVQKIKSWYDEESDNHVHALVESEEVGIFDLKITAPIKYVWNFTVQFIQWFNTTKPQPNAK